MKRWKLGLIALIPVLILCGLVLREQADPYRTVTALFAQDRAELTAAAKAVLARGSAEGVEPPDGCQKICYYDQSVPTVEFQYGCRGMGSESSYWGLSYTPDDQPVGFQGSRWDYWRQQGKGRLWYEPEGDNRCYVERLDSGWYYYKMDF